MSVQASVTALFTIPELIQQFKPLRGSQSQARLWQMDLYRWQ